MITASVIIAACPASPNAYKNQSNTCSSRFIGVPRAEAAFAIGEIDLRQLTDVARSRRRGDRIEVTLLQRMSPFLALLRHHQSILRSLLSGANRTTFAHTEFFSV